MNWIKEHSKTILLISIPVLLLIDILTRYFFILHLEFDSTIFNNVITPIGTVVSAILFFYALALTIKQNKIILSQSLKPHFDEKFKRIEEDFQKTGRLPNYGARPKATAKKMVDDLWEIYRALSQDAEFQDDLHSHINNIGFKPNIKYFQSRTYHELAQCLTSYATNTLWDLKAVVEFIDDINSSNLVDDDKKYLKKRIKEVLVDEYFWLIENNDFDDTMFYFPFLRYKDPFSEIQFVHLLRQPNFRKYYEVFKKEL